MDDFHVCLPFKLDQRFILEFTRSQFYDKNVPVVAISPTQSNFKEDLFSVGKKPW